MVGLLENDYVIADRPDIAARETLEKNYTLCLDVRNSQLYDTLRLDATSYPEGMSVRLM